MKLASCTYSYRQLLSAGQMTLVGFLDTCRDLGLDGVELTQYYFPKEGDAYLHRIKREAFARGLDVCGAAVGGNFSNADPQKRRAQIEHVKDWLVKSAKLGAPCLRVFAGRQPEDTDLQTARKWVTDGLAECARVAADCGVVLALESHGGLTADAEGCLALLAPFAEEPWVGMNLDFGNFTGDVYEQYALCAPHAVTTHAKVTVRQGNGREQVDYRRVVRIMREAGYEGYLSIEYEDPQEPVAGVDRFAAYLRGCIVDA